MHIYVCVLYLHAHADTLVTNDTWTLSLSSKKDLYDQILRPFLLKCIQLNYRIRSHSCLVLITDELIKTKYGGKK